MRTKPLLRGSLLLAASLAILAPALADEPADLAVRKLRVQMKKKGATCKLRLALPLDPVLDTVDMRTDDVAVRIGDATVLALPPAAERTRLREKKPLLWKYRAGRRGPKLTVDLAFRDVRLVVRKADLESALAAWPQGVKVALDLGDRTFETIVDVDARGRVLKLRPEEPPVGSPPVDPGDPGGGGTPAPVTATTIEVAWYSGISRPETAVARTPSEWAALWARHKGNITPRPPLPAVDFSSEMVVAVFLGDRPDPSHSIELARATSDGATTVVEYRDVRQVPSPSGACFFPAVVTQPSLLVRVPRTERATTSGRIVQRPCP